MSKAKHDPLVIPALRAVMGDRVYFTTTMKLGEVADRVSYADEIHTNKDLNDLIQRRLNQGRSQEIAEYLMNESQRFFNSLVVGVYAGDPQWYDFGHIKPEETADRLVIPSHASETFGFLQMDGSEELFAIDGQHRLVGIRKAIQKDVGLAEERVSVIFVAHESGPEGLQRTRRLFTVLNKSAKPVRKGDIIALDEDDMMAICTRRLLDTERLFNRGQVAMRLQNSLPPSDTTSWTTIYMLYDVLSILFTQAYPWSRGGKRVPAKNLKTRRADEETISEHFNFAVDYFRLLADHFSEVGSALDGEDTAQAVQANRHDAGGHILFRPIGQQIFTQIVANLCKDNSLADSVKSLSALPTALSAPPYADVVWDVSKKSMVTTRAAKSLCRDLLSYMIGAPIRRSESNLKNRYADFLGVSHEEAELPPVLNAA